MVKRIGMVVLALALVVSASLATLWIWGPGVGSAEAQTSSTEANLSSAQTITVVGQGSVRVKPDIAQVSIGIETSAESVTDAVEQNAVQMDAILKALAEAGIAEKDIRTTNFSIQLEQNPEPRLLAAESSEEQPKSTYRVHNLVNVTIRDLDAVSEILDAVIQAGANNIWGVNFSLEDTTAAETDARADAVADAAARAEALAELSGVQLGPVMSVSEVVGGSTPFMAQGLAERAAIGAGPISPGELEIGYQVQVVYFIER